jgi:PGAP1-like protein
MHNIRLIHRCGVLVCYLLNLAIAFSPCSIWPKHQRATTGSTGSIRIDSVHEQGYNDDSQHPHRLRGIWLYNSVNGAIVDAAASSEPSNSSTQNVTSNETTVPIASARENDAMINEQVSSNKKQRRRRVAVLVCPAQFCVPADYEQLFTLLRQQQQQQHSISNDIVIGTCQVANLPRTEWIKVAQQLPTMEFFNAQLPVEPTLRWYFDAIEQGLADIMASEHTYMSDDDDDDDDDDAVSICLIGHSIGGWVARAYLGGLSLSSSAIHQYAKSRISSFITLGTPHTSPKTALVDQTRGLLSSIEASSECTPQALIDQSSCNTDRLRGPMEITCVCSSAVRGNFFTTNVEELIAASSYLPLTGKGNGVVGDGIVPLDLAFLGAPAKRLVLTECTRTQQPIRHCHVLPTPWNLVDGYAPSIALPSESFPSYISDGVVQQWVHCVR